MKCDILCCYGDKLLDRLIAYLIGGKITHIAIKDSDTTVVETVWPKTRRLSLQEFNDDRSYITLRCVELTEEQKDAIIAYVNSKINTKYDFKLILAITLKKLFGINIKLDDPHRYICEELVLEAFKEAVGIVLIDKPENEIEPVDFLAEAPCLTFVSNHTGNKYRYD